MYSDFRDQNRNPVAASVVLAAIKKPIIKTSVEFEVHYSTAFTPRFYVEEKDIIRGSLIISNSCASDGIKLGSVNIGMLKVTIKNEKMEYVQAPSELIDCHFHPQYELEIDDNTTVTVNGGEYWIKEVEQLREGVKLTCYDSMCKLDEPFTLGTITGTPYQILTQATTACGVPLKSTQAEIEALPNGARTFTLHSDNDCKTWRDVLSYLSMLMGCFVTFARYTGALAFPGLVVRPFGNGKESFCDTVTDVHRYKGAKFSIFDTEYKAIELTAYAVDGENTVKKDFTYAETTGVTGQTIKLGYNPFIQADTPEADLTQTQRDILHELLTQVDKYAYTPMQISLPVGFIYDLGDVIKCTGGLANTGFAGSYTEDCYCCISNYTYTYGKEFRIKTLESKAAKARPIVIPFSATLNVTVVNGTGATITATDGTNTYTATESGGSASLTILIPGTYTVSAELDGETGSITDTVTMNVSGTYTAEVGFTRQADQFYIPSDNPFADYFETVTAFWAAKNIEKLYYTQQEWQNGYIYDSFPPNVYIVIFWDASDGYLSVCLGSAEAGLSVRRFKEGHESQASFYELNYTFTYNEKTVYYRWIEDNDYRVSTVQTEPTVTNTNNSVSLHHDKGRRAWLMVYGGYDT